MCTHHATESNRASNPNNFFPIDQPPSNTRGANAPQSRLKNVCLNGGNYRVYGNSAEAWCRAHLEAEKSSSLLALTGLIP